jgi:L-malate glycosyltransferase
MKILQLVTKRQYRGAEVFAANLSAELIELGHEITFVGLYQNDENTLEVENAVHYDLIKSKDGSFSISLVGKLTKLIRAINPDIIQCNGSDTLKYMVAASFFIPKTPILYRNISMISEWATRGPKKLLYKQFFKRIDHVTSVGDEAILDFIKTFNYPKTQTTVIRRGIPIKNVNRTSNILKLKNELGLNESDVIVMHIGNFSPEKNHTFLLDLFEELKLRYSQVKLVCIGNGVLYESIEKEVQRRNLNKTIFLLGFRKDIPELLSTADCFVLPSKVEGVPGVILEAGTQKVPTVATNVGGVSEVLMNGKTGYIIENFDKNSFKQTLLKIVLNDDLKNELGLNAFNLVEKEFNPLRNAKKFESLYQELVQKN